MLVSITFRSIVSQKWGLPGGSEVKNQPANSGDADLIPGLGRRRGGQGPHLAKRWEPRGFSRDAAGFSSYDGDLSLPLGV